MDGSFVMSEIDMGDGSGTDDVGGVGSQTPPTAPAPASTPDTGQQPDPQPEQTPATDQAPAQEGVQPGTTEELVKWETAPEHFRNSYEKVKTLRERAEAEAAAYKAELEAERGRYTRDVYLSTNVPIEDFKPAEALLRMSTEEPEYHDMVVDAVLEAHLWPNMVDAVKSLDGKQFGRYENGEHVFDNDEDRFQYKQLESLWDALAQRVSGLSGAALERMIVTVASNPKILQEIQTAAGLPPSQTFGQGQAQPGQPQRGYSGQQASVPTLEQVAAQGSFDLSDPDQRRWAEMVQGNIAQTVALQSQFGSELRRRDAEIRRMQGELSKVQNTQKEASTTSAAEAERQAESKVEEYLKTAIDTEFTERFATAIPKDRAGLGDRLKTLTRDRLNNDPNFKHARSTAMKFYKQAATATGDVRKRYEQKALDAMGVMTTLRATAMAEEAKELLGKLPAQVAAARARTEQRKDRRELPAGSNAPGATTQTQSPAGEPGDREAFRKRVRENMQRAGIRMS